MKYIYRYLYLDGYVVLYIYIFLQYILQPKQTQWSNEHCFQKKMSSTLIVLHVCTIISFYITNYPKMFNVITFL